MREERASRIVTQYPALGRIDVRELALSRATVFVTHRCNFACRYCNGPHINDSIPRETRKDFLSRRFTRESFQHLLDDWEKHKLRQPGNFTGGEATLAPDLPWFMEQAAERKMLVSLTTNGSSPPALYRRLVESGMTEVRISIDSHDAAEFDKIVGVNGAFRRVENTIRELVRLRDEEQRSIFIILNVSTLRSTLNGANTLSTISCGCAPTT